MPRLEEAIAKHLGDRSDAESWLRYEDDPAVHSPVVHFAYPLDEQGGFDYLRRQGRPPWGACNADGSRPSDAARSTAAATTSPPL